MSVMNEPELGSARLRAEDGRGACVPMSCGVVYSLYVSIADAPLDYVATLLVMTGRDSNELPCCVCGGTVTCMVQVLSATGRRCMSIDVRVTSD